jgi:hypothetical protein
MRSIFTLFMVCLITSAGWAQTNKFLSAIDAEVAPNPYLESGTAEWQVFLADSKLDAKVDIQNFDVELLAAAVFHTTNKYRKRHGRTELSFSVPLDIAAQNYLNFYSSNTFNRTDKNAIKLNKAAGFAVRQLGFQPRLVDVVVNKKKLINHNGGSFFYNRLDNETELHLFYGHKDDLKDSAYLPEAVPLYTYRSLAESVVEQNVRYPNGQCLRSRAYSYMSCRIELDERTVHKNQIPTGKVIIIFGGYRTQDYKMRKREARATAAE